VVGQGDDSTEVRAALGGGLLPVYVRRQEGGKWFFVGLHEVTGSTAEIPAIKQRLKLPVITGSSRVVFLKRVQEAKTARTLE